MSQRRTLSLGWLRDPWALSYLFPIPLLVVLALRTWSVIPHDTDEYLAHTVTRPPLYPLFLDLTRLLFGRRFLPGTAVLQELLNAGAAFWFARTLATRLDLGRLAVLLYYLLLLPGVQAARVIGSEALSYDLFLLLNAAIVEAIFEPTVRRLLRPLIFAVLAISTRAQFLFALPVLAVGGVVALRSLSRRAAATLVLSAVGILVAQSVLTKAYNYAINRQFAAAPVTGIQLLTMNTYLMRADDLALFEAPEDRRYMAKVYERASDKALLYENKQVGDPTTHHLYEKYAFICYDVLAATWAEQFTEHRFDRELQARSLASDELVAMDHHMLHLSLVLVKHRFARYVTLVFKCWYQYSGLFGVLATLLFGVAVIRVFQGADRTWLVLGFAYLMWAANNLLVCMVEAILWRYTCYTDTLMLVTMLAAFLHFARPTAPRT